MNIERLTSDLAKDFDDFETEFEGREYDSELGISGSNFQDVIDSHSLIYYKAIHDSVESKRLARRSELLVKNIKSEVGLRIRKERDEEGLKTTEAMLQELIDNDPIAQSARDIRSECQLLEYETTMLISAFEHRRSMINNRVSLFGFKDVTNDVNVKTLKEKTGRTGVRRK